MSLITYSGLVSLASTGVIEGAKLDHINAASIDVRLGNRILVEASPNGLSSVVDLAGKEVPALREIDLDTNGYYDLRPGDFCLAGTLEKFNLPNDIAAEYRLNSSLARAGLDAALAMWCDPGWFGSVLTLELSNSLRYHSLRLRPGMRIGQMIFLRGDPVPEEASYASRGKYNGDSQAQQSKGLG